MRYDNIHSTLAYICSTLVLLQHSLETERLEWNPIAHEMLTHSLDPVQTEGVQHGTRTFHDDEDRDREEEPHVERDDDHEDAEGSCDGQTVGEGHVPENDGELLMGEGERPETEVGCCVRNTVETEFCDVLAFDTISDEFPVHTNGVDDLMNHNFTELKLLMLFITKVLSNHSNAFAVTVHTGSSVQSITVIIISI